MQKIAYRKIQKILNGENISWKKDSFVKSFTKGVSGDLKFNWYLSLMVSYPAKFLLETFPFLSIEKKIQSILIKH